MAGKALIPIKFTFANGSTKSNRRPIREAETDDNGALAVTEIDLHTGFPSAAVVEIRFGMEDTDAAHVARYKEDGTLISFAGESGRAVSLEPARNCTVKKYAQMVSATTIATGGICVAYLREV